jgi:hypothetical protein
MCSSQALPSRTVQEKRGRDRMEGEERERLNAYHVTLESCDGDE